MLSACGDLGGRAVPPIARPVPALVAVGPHPAGHQFGDRGQPPRPRCGFHPGRLLDPRDERLLVGTRELIEHIFDDRRLH